MSDAIDDRGPFWPPLVDWRARPIRRDGWSAREAEGVFLHLVSGDVDAARSQLSPGAIEIGLWAIAAEDELAVRLSRHSAHLVTPRALSAGSGWREEGWTCHSIDGALLVLEIDGPRMIDIVARATTVDLKSGSRSASCLFAGIRVALYRIGEERARLHVERHHATYLWQWFDELGAP